MDYTLGDWSDLLTEKAGIRVVNRGQGGQTSGAAASLLDSALRWVPSPDAALILYCQKRG